MYGQSGSTLAHTGAGVALFGGMYSISEVLGLSVGLIVLGVASYRVGTRKNRHADARR